MDAAGSRLQCVLPLRARSRASARLRVRSDNSPADGQVAADAAHKKAPVSHESRGFCYRCSVLDERVADVQDLHAVGATDGVVAVTLGQDDPVALLDQTALEQLVRGGLADLTGRQRSRGAVVIWFNKSRWAVKLTDLPTLHLYRL